MDFSEFNHLSHIVVGTIAFVGGIIALSTEKGSRIHKIGGRVFALGMFYAVISAIVFMTEEFLPLAVLMSVTTVYLLISSAAALRYRKKYSKIIDTLLIIFPFILFVFTTTQFVRILPEISLGTFARLLFSLTFVILLLRGFKLIKSRPVEHLFYLKRHSFRMILAFGFAVMAVLRIGVKIEFLGLAFTTFAPLLLALLAAFYVELNMSKLMLKKKQ